VQKSKKHTIQKRSQPDAVPNRWDAFFEFYDMLDRKVRTIV